MTGKILCVTDLDGTFVKDSKIISAKDLQAYEKLKKLGDFALATGRSLKEIHYLVDKYKLNLQHAIAFNGALVESGDKIIFAQEIAKSELNPLLEYLAKEKLIFDALDNQARLGNYWTDESERLWGMELIQSNQPFHLLDNRTIYKINIRPEKSQTAHYLDDLGQSFLNLEVFEAGARRIEVTAKAISKGSGLKKVKGPYDLTIAFGDSGNDLALFEEVDIAYCMSHSPQAVKEKADYVLDTFAQAVDHLEGILAKQLNHYS
ncbi:Cof-type HAD-IIB family hydrolase [Streptococcus didelphis]|uniref:Cof-type HAD-IIB family hydrolase n=1 Tax=Streptococcus didelphis TaxID=102886 RepID=A0ABY9LFP9_9STRE|nr:HAD family hydrolase [Streptococcus didelphis]WMB27704.1 Cof-type HAD-IIB family hydrolase [Streptococcus didelphis]WMB29836.1 Cof-type HAD-IIB family hydrolase [Streptococcus didelphis]